MKKTEKPKYLIHQYLDDILWEVRYWWRNSIISNIKSFFVGIENLRKWRKIIWNDRWWDHAFMMEILEFKLKDMESNWGTNTHYVGDLDEKETLKKLLDDISWMNNPENELIDGYTEEYKKRSKRFFGRLERNHLKFWD